jgi:NTE family protein
MKILVALSFFFLISCQSKEKKSDQDLPQSQTVIQSNQTAAPSIPTAIEPEAVKIQSDNSYNQVKIGIILGPGALRSFAHVGVLTEFAKAKLPIQAIAGIEMGSLVAAIYANKGQPYDVEWQMMKLKESDLVQKGLLSSSLKAGEVQSLNEFMNMALSSNRAENSKINFACPAFHIGKRQNYTMNKGAFSQMLPFCISFPPLFKPYQQNIAGVLDLKPLIEYMKTKGVNYVVYVDLLSGNTKLDSANFETESLWSLAAANLARQEKSVNEVVRVPLQDYSLTDFSHRREIMQRGQQVGQKAAQDIKKNLGL